MILDRLLGRREGLYRDALAEVWPFDLWHDHARLQGGNHSCLGDSLANAVVYSMRLRLYGGTMKQ